MKDAPSTLLQDEVFRKIGRNLLLFQQAELLMRRLLALDAMSYRSGESPECFEQRCSTYQNMTMGQIAALFLERLCGKDPPSTPSGDNGHSGVSICFSVRLGNRMQLEERRASIAALIGQRNEFVHHLFPQFASADPDGLKLLSEEVDAQCVQIREEVSRLKQDLESARSLLDAIVTFVTWPEGTTELFGHEIRNSPLIRNLAEIASQSEDPEGWIPLREAIGRLKDFPDAKISDHCAQFGHKSLSALLTGSGLFETGLAEATADYHGRTVFRLARRASSDTAAPLIAQAPEAAANTGN